MGEHEKMKELFSKLGIYLDDLDNGLLQRAGAAGVSPARIAPVASVIRLTKALEASSEKQEQSSSVLNRYTRSLVWLTRVLVFVGVLQIILVIISLAG